MRTWPTVSPLIRPVFIFPNRLSHSSCSRGKTLSAYEQPLGLTVWSSEYALNYRPQVAQLGARKYCARIDTVKLDLIIKDMDV